jgi:hypothetical protein
VPAQWREARLDQRGAPGARGHTTCQRARACLTTRKSITIAHPSARRGAPYHTQPPQHHAALRTASFATPSPRRLRHRSPPSRPSRSPPENFINGIERTPPVREYSSSGASSSKRARGREQEHDREQEARGTARMTRELIRRDRTNLPPARFLSRLSTTESPILPSLNPGPYYPPGAKVGTGRYS